MEGKISRLNLFIIAVAVVAEVGAIFSAPSLVIGKAKEMTIKGKGTAVEMTKDERA